MKTQFIEDVYHVTGIRLTERQMILFDRYYQYLIAFNKHTNLTAIEEEKDVYYKHFLDSIALVRSIKKKTILLCDMGAGAGFPSIPLKIVYPMIRVVIVDSLNKRVQFLNELIQKLELTDIEIHHERAEVFALSHNKQFDVVTARAFGSMPMILEMGMPMLKVKGLCIAMKAKDAFEEIQKSEHALEVLHGKIVKIDEYELPFNMGKRVQIVVSKEKDALGYPRSFSMIKNKPL